jgi:HlyD family secretion protein
VKRAILGVLALAGLAVLWAVWQWKSQVPVVPAAKIARGAFADSVTTNGKVEPSQWASARAEREGLVIAAPVTAGQRVAQGAPLAILDTKDSQADLAAAQARIEEAKAEIALLSAGGAKRELVDIDEAIKQKRQEKSLAEKDLAIAERLLSKQAGTREEVRAAKDRVDSIDLQIRGLESKRPALVGPADLSRAQARLREAQSSAEQAQRRIALGTVRSPISGVAYQVDAKLGAYLAPGALVANIGETDTLKVIVYVDEPELGRVAQGMPVTITWDALDGKSWKGTVQKTPTQIVPLGTRQVGEVEVKLENPGGELTPGANVNASIETKEIPNAILVPKEAIRTVNNEEGVYLIANDTLEFRKVKFGARNVVAAVALEGIEEGDLVALGPEANLKPGLKIQVAP